MSVQELLHDAAAPVAPLHRRVSARQGFAALCVALILIGAMLLLLRPGSAPAPDRLGATATPALATLDAPALAALPEPVAPTRELLFDERLSRVDERQDDLDAALERIGAQLDRLTAELARLDAVDASLGERLSTLSRPAPVAVRAARPPAPQPVAQVLPTLVSVDVWGGRPSAAIRGVDGEVRFYAEGDTVGVARLLSINASSRSVTLELGDGKTSTLKVRG